MIERLTVKNYALIEEISVDFSSGFNVLSGETGAGKSILVGALGLLLGAKADCDAIRTGKEESTVSAVFNIENHLEAKAWLKERGMQPEEGTVLIRRTIRRTGRGAVYLQSNPVTLAELTQFSGLLVDMHSQHAHQSLMRADNHRKLLDHYVPLDAQVAQLSDKFHHLSRLKKEKEELQKSELDRERDLDYLEFAVKEIEAANLKDNEEEKLTAELKIITQSEKLFSLLQEFNSNVSESKGGALSSLRNATSLLKSIAEIDQSQASVLDRFISAFYEIEDISETLTSWKNSIDFSPETLDRLQERMQLITKLTRKFGGSIAAVNEYKEEATDKINLLQDSTFSLEKLQQEMDSLEDDIRRDALYISQKRKEAASLLEAEITTNLVKLGMEKAQFGISIETREMENGKPACGPYGIDMIRFVFSANPGEPMKELRSIASGGELSRVMLSIKSVFADKDPIQTLVFDEIDTGIGGAVARSVAAHISSLGEYKQILCISHLAAIAAKADKHFQIRKESRGDHTVTYLQPLEEEERVREIGRMLSGDSVTDVSLDHARQLILEKY